MFKLKIRGVKLLVNLDGDELKKQLETNFNLVWKAFKERKIKYKDIIKEFGATGCLSARKIAKAYNNNTKFSITDTNETLFEKALKIYGSENNSALASYKGIQKLFDNSNKMKKRPSDDSNVDHGYDILRNYDKNRGVKKYEKKAKKLLLARNWKHIDIHKSLEFIANVLRKEPKGYFESIISHQCYEDGDYTRGERTLTQIVNTFRTWPETGKNEINRESANFYARTNIKNNNNKEVKEEIQKNGTMSLHRAIPAYQQCFRLIADDLEIAKNRLISAENDRNVGYRRMDMLKQTVIRNNDINPISEKIAEVFVYNIGAEKGAEKPEKFMYKYNGKEGQRLFEYVKIFYNNFKKANNNNNNKEKIKILKMFKNNIKKINSKKFTSSVCRGKYNGKNVDLTDKIKECVVPYIDYAIEKLSSN